MNRRALFALAPAAVLAPVAGVLTGAVAAVLAAPAAASSSEGGTASKGGYIAFPTVTATVVRYDGQLAVLAVEAGIDIKDAELHARAAQEMPRLRAAYNDVVQTLANSMPPGGTPDVERLHHDLQRATARTLKRGGAVFLIGSVTVT